MPPVASILGRAAAWPPSYLHRLPDSAFLHVEPGGALDASGRTSPRSLRHLPILDADGHLDLPHLRDALAQLPNAGPWLPPETRDALIAKAKGLHATALSSTHKASKGLPDWSLGYLSHLDRHEALGVGREDAHKAWRGDAMLGKRAQDLLKGLKRGGSPVAKAATGEPSTMATLRRKAADFNARAGDRPGTKVTPSMLAAVHDRGTAAYDASKRPVVKSRDQWGSGRVNAFLRLVASGKPDHPGYVADHDLLPAGHPRATKQAAPSKPGTVVRPKMTPPPEKPPAQPTPTPPTTKPKATAKPPRGKAPLPVKAKPVEAEKAVDTSMVGEEVSRTGGTPWPDVDMGYLASPSVYDQLDRASSYARRDAEIPTDATGDVGPVDWRLPGSDVVAKDEMGGGDLAAGGKLAPEQDAHGHGGDLPGFERRTWQGIPVVVDRPKGTVQTGIGKDGEAWSRTYSTDYGFVPATLGGDGEELDVFLGPDESAPVAYVVVQQDDDGEFDELKVMLGYASAEAARECYVAHIPERYLSRLYPVPVALLQGMLGMEPDVVAKAGQKPRRSFVIEQGKVKVRWPTTVWSNVVAPPPEGPEDESGPESTPRPSSSSAPAAPVAAAAPEPPPSGAAPESPASFNAKARRAKALASVRKAVAYGPTYEGARPLPEALAQHPALTSAPTDTYTSPAEVGGWVYVIDGGDTPDADPNWIAFVGIDGKSLLWTSRDKDGGVNGVPYAFRRDDLIKPDAEGRLPLIGWTTPIMGQPTAKMAIDVCPNCGARMSAHTTPKGTHWTCPACGKEYDDVAATAANINASGAPFVALDADEMEAAAKAARAVQAMLPAGPSRSIDSLDETEKGMDGGALLYSHVDPWHDPDTAAGLLGGFQTVWLAEVPDTPKARRVLAKAGATFTHPDVPGVLFAASYVPEHVDVLNPNVDAGDDEASAWQTKAGTVPGPDADVPVHAKPPGSTAGSPDADRGVPPALVDGAKVGKAASDLAFIRIGKADGEQEQRFALGPVLVPNVADLQGDIISPEEIERSERRFMELYQNAGIQHEAEPSEINGFRDANPDLANGKIVIVESYIVRDDRGFAEIGGRKMPTGTWIMGSIYLDDAIWEEVKTGRRTGYSIGGYARRVPIGSA